MITLDDGGNQHVPTQPTEREKAAIVAGDKRRAASDRKIAEMTVDAWIATRDGREMTPAESKNPAWTEGMTAWAGCPFSGDEAFNVASAVGYIRKKAAEAGRDKKGQETAVELNRMADKLSVTCKKIQQRAIREAEMQVAQATNAAARS